MKNRLLFQKITVLILSVLMLSGCFRKPNKPTSPFIPKKPPETTQATAPPPDIEEPKEMREGNSRAIDVTPFEGLHIMAEENAFDTDPVIRAIPLSDTLDDVKELNERLKEDDYYLLWAYDIDCGMTGDDTIPGSYHVELDLSVTGIKEEYYDCLKAVRYGEDGEPHELCSKVENGVLSYDTNTNSPIGLAAIGGLVIAGVSDYLHHSYFWTHSGKYCRKDGKTDYGSFYIEWLMQDIEPRYDKKVKRAAELEKQHSQEASEWVMKELKERPWAAYLKNQMYLEYYEEALKLDREYAQLRKDLDEPEVITKTFDRIKEAYNYLGAVEGVRMPLYTVPFESTECAGLGVATNLELTYSFIELNLKGNVVWYPKQEDWDDLQLTIIHELLHVCQNRYHFPIDIITDSTRYDEMVARYTEEKAYNYYVAKKEMVEVANKQLTPSSHWHTMRVPIDGSEDGEIAGSIRQDKMIEEGYTLGSFLVYMAGKVCPHEWISAHTLMKQRAFFTSSTISGPVSKAFEIPQTEFDIHFRNYFISKRYVIGDKYPGVYSNMFHKKREQREIKAGQKIHIPLEPGPAYFMEIKGFRQQGTEATPALLVPDANIKSAAPDLNIAPCISYKNFAKGAYISELRDYDGVRMLPVAEVHGGSKVTGSDIGYSVYLMGKPGTPTAFETQDVLKVQLPKNSEAAKDKVIEGYLMTIRVEGKNDIEKEIPPEQFEKEIEIKKKELFKGAENAENLRIEITIKEFVKVAKDQKLFGPESDPASWNVGPETGLDKFNGYWCPVELKVPGEDDWIIAIAYLPDDNEFGYFEGPAGKWNKRSRWSEITEFEYDAKTGELIIEFDMGVATFEINSSGNLVMHNHGGTNEFHRITNYISRYKIYKLE